MKKTLILSLFFALVLAFTGCGGRFNFTTEPTTTVTTNTTTNSNTDTSTTGATTTSPVSTLPAEKVTISYWNPLTGADGASMRQMVDMFNEEYEGYYEVVETYTNETDYYTNLNLLVPMGRGPDVAIMHSYLVQSYANSEIIIPIENYIQTSGADIDTEHYLDAVMSTLYFNDDLYAIPLDIHVTGLYYNIDLLDKYSLAVPTNRSELIETASFIQNAEQNLGNTVWGLPLSTTWPSEWLFTTSLYQNNGLELDAQGNPAYNSVEGKTAMRMVTDLIHEEGLSPLNLSVDQDLFYFQTGQAVFHIQGCWMLQDIVDSGINFGVLPLSNMFNEDGETYSEAIAARSHTFVVPYQTKTVSDAKKTAIMTFVKYIGDNSFIWAEAGQIPASNIARATAEYAALPYLSGFGDVNNFRLAAASPYYHEAYSPIYSRVTAAMSNPNYDIDGLFSAAVQEAEQLIAEAQG